MRCLVIGVWWLASCRWITARAACEVSVEVSGSTYTIVLPDHLPFGTAEAAEVIAQISPGGELSLLSGGCADDTCLAERLVAHARASLAFSFNVPSQHDHPIRRAPRRAYRQLRLLPTRVP